MTMNKTLLKTIVGFGCALAMASTSQADTISLTFEGLQDFEPINTYYDGGSGGFGSTAPSAPATSSFGGGGFGSAPSTAVSPTTSWGTTPVSSTPAVNASGKKVIPTFDQPAI